MAVKVTSSGPRGSKTYEIRVNGHLYDYTDNLGDARRIAARARKEEKTGKKNPAKSVRLSNFTGTIKKNANGTVSISGRAKRRNPSKRSVRKRVGAALRKYVRGKR